jgi:hypothetical protein
VTPGGRAHPALANFTLATAFILFIWALLGPLQSNWNASANNGNGSGHRSSSQVAPAADIEITSARTSIPNVSAPMVTAAILPTTEAATAEDAGEGETQ